MKATGRAEAEPWSKAKAKRIFSSWHIYVFPLLYVIWVRFIKDHSFLPTLTPDAQNNGFSETSSVSPGARANR